MTAGLTRRHILQQAGAGFGGLALQSLLGADGVLSSANPMAPRAPLFAPKAKSVIFLFMYGGPSHVDLFDPKPALAKWHGQPIPLWKKEDSFMVGKTKNVAMKSPYKFAKHGDAGIDMAEVYPNLARHADDLCMIRSMHAESNNHGPALFQMNSGFIQAGRPSMGSWVTYGLGSESQNLPGFVVLQSGPRGPRGGAVNWASGFLPTSYQGVPLRGSGDPILNISSPKGVTAQRQRDCIDAVRDLNLKRLVETGDQEISTRISAYEMAYRMQSSAPELIDLSGESAATLKLYGVDKDKPSFARNCLLARRLVERGSRFVQLYHTNWDSHGGPGENLEGDFEKVCREVDQGQAALVHDLKARGLLDDTLVIWGGEFGRTPMGENRDTTGRNHHIDAFTMWFAGGGVKRGAIVGETDELGFNPASDRCHVHDIHATILHLLGIEHEKLTFKFQGRDFRLTDVHGELIHKMLA